MNDAGHGAPEESVGSTGRRWPTGRTLLVCVLGALALLAVGAISAGALLTGTSASASPTPISHVCVNKSSGQLFYYLTSTSCKKGQTQTAVTSTSTQFKACYQASNGLTRKVPESTKCSNKLTRKEIEIPKVPADSDSLYFCVGTDGTMYYKPGTSPPTCPTGQSAVVIGPHNRPPTAANDSYSVPEDTTVHVRASGGVLANDSDPDNEPITAQLGTDPSHGTLTLNSDGSFSYAPAANYNGPDSFTYKAKDSHNSLSAAATVSITVNPVNDAPVPEDDSKSTSENTPLVFPAGDLVANDSEGAANESAQNLAVTEVKNPTRGTVDLDDNSTPETADDEITFTPETDYNGDEAGFDYTVCDDGSPLLCSTASVNVTVGPLNSKPEAQNGTQEMEEDGAPITIDLGALVSDEETADDANLTYNIVQGPTTAQGELTGTGPTFTFEPAADFNGTVEVSYKVTDRGDPDNCGTPDADCAAPEESETKTVTITVNPVDDQPVANGDNASTDEDTPTDEIDVLANDTGIGDGPVTVTIETDGAKGTAAVNPNNTVTYTPNTDASGSDSFVYEVCDADGDCDTANVALTINSVDDQPDASGDAASTDEDTPTGEIDVLANDTGIGDGPVSVRIETQGTKGTATVNANNTVTYTPDADADGSDSFVYEVCDADGDCDTANVALTINAINDAPTLDLDNTTDGIGSTAEFQEADGLAVTLAPNAEVADVDDTNLESAKVTLTNRPDGDEVESLDADVGSTGIIKSYDSSTGVLTLTGPATKAQFEQVLRTVSYDNTATPPEGTDRVVEFTVNDGDVDSAVATATVTVRPLNEPPEIDLNGGAEGMGHSATFTEDAGAVTIMDADNLTVTDTDDTNLESATITLTNRPDGNAESLSVDTTGTNIDAAFADGVLTLTGADSLANYQQVLRTVKYVNTSDTPDTTDRVVEFTVSDGLDDSATATSTVSVVAADDPPVAVDDSATQAEDSDATAINVLANDSDVDGSTKTVDSVTQPTNGTVAISGGGSGLTYQPDQDYCNDQGDAADDTFTYTINGGDTATVSVTVTCVDDPPGANDDSRTVGEDSGATSFDVLTNDTDVDGDQIEITGVSDPANSTVAVVEGSPDQVSYQPEANYCNNPPGTAPDTFTYTINGGDTATVSVTVTCVDDPPVAVNDSATVIEDAAATAIDVLANETDVDGGPKTISSVTQPTNGTVAITGGGTGLTYQPKANYCNEPPGTTPDTFTYKLNGDSQGTVSVKVTCVNDAPQADNETFNGTSRAIGNTSLVVNDADDGAPDPNGPQKTVTGDILDGDADVDGPGPLTVTGAGTDGSNGQTTGGGQITVQPDGDFTYHPESGCGDANDTFKYTVSDGHSPTPGTAQGTVTLDIADCVWYVDDSALGGDGRSHSPYNSLASINSAGGAGDRDSAGNKIFLYDGTYSGGLPLESSQSLFTEKHGLVVSDGGAGNLTLEPNDGTGSTLNGGLAVVSGNNVQGLSLGTTGSASVYALSGSSVGTFTMNNVTGGDLNNPAGGAINIGGTGNALNVQFGTLSSSGSSGNAVSILNASGTVSGQSGTLTNATGTTVNLNGGTLDFTLNGAVSDDAGQLISISNKTSGTTDFNGPVDDVTATPNNGGGISLQSNGTALTRFDGGLNLSTGSSNGLVATSGGTLAIPDPAGTATNSIASTTGTPLNVASTTIHGDDLVFEKISSNGSTNGIVLNNTGTSGNLSVTGNSGVCTIATPTCSGGTIQSTTGDGISLTNTSSPSFNLLRVLNTAGHGISGTTTSGLSLSNSLIQGAGDADNETGLFFANVNGTNLTGNSSITNTVVHAPADVGAFIQNYGGTLNLTVSGSTFSGTQKNTPGVVTGDDLLRMISDRTTSGSATITARITGSTFRNSESDDILANAQSSTGSGGGTMNLTVDGNTFDGQGVFEQCETIGCNSYGIVTQGTQGGTIRYTIQNNSIVHHLDAGIAARSDNNSNVQGVIKNNTIGTAGESRSGSYRDRGIFLASDDSSDFVASVENNVIHSTFFEGISASTTDGTGLSPKMDLTILGNTTPTPADTGGTYLPSINMTASGNASACARTENNTAQPGSSGAGSIDFLLFRDTATSTATFKLEGLAAPTADASSFVKSKNPASLNPVYAFAAKDGSNTSTPQFTGGTCRTPAATPTP